MRVIIIGAGAIGMMQARDLALKGLDVVLLERHETGSEASWAGGGIVSPLYPWRYSEPVTVLARWSQAFYPNLVESLEAESDVDPELSKHGLLMLDVDDREDALRWAQEHQAWMGEINQSDIYKLEPNLREGVKQGLWMPQVASVRNPRLLSALKKSLSRLPNIEIIEQANVTGFNRNGQRVTGVEVEGRSPIQADAIVVCAGSWTSHLLHGSTLEVRPIKGQMLLFKAEPGLVNRVVLSNCKYVIPRRDGGVLAGSTLEDTGFDKYTTTDAKEVLADMAIDLFPALATCPVTHHWAGLRPSAPEGIPYIGRLPEYENLFVNAGHFRNGLVLAPASIALLSAIVCGEQAPFDPAPYDPGKR